MTSSNVLPSYACNINVIHLLATLLGGLSIKVADWLPFYGQLLTYSVWIVTACSR